MKVPFIILAVTALALAVAMLAPRIYWLATDKDYYGWPAVTKCRACDKTVWEWQAYERRDIPVEIENQNGVMMGCSMTGLMHTKCGAPKPAKVTIELHLEPKKPSAEWF